MGYAIFLFVFPSWATRLVPSMADPSILLCGLKVWWSFRLTISSSLYLVTVVGWRVTTTIVLLWVPTVWTVTPSVLDFLPLRPEPGLLSMNRIGLRHSVCVRFMCRTRFFDSCVFVRVTGALQFRGRLRTTWRVVVVAVVWMIVLGLGCGERCVTPLVTALLNSAIRRGRQLTSCFSMLGLHRLSAVLLSWTSLVVGGYVLTSVCVSADPFVFDGLTMFSVRFGFMMKSMFCSAVEARFGGIMDRPVILSWVVGWGRGACRGLGGWCDSRLFSWP